MDEINSQIKEFRPFDCCQKNARRNVRDHEQNWFGPQFPSSIGCCRLRCCRHSKNPFLFFSFLSYFLISFLLDFCLFAFLFALLGECRSFQYLAQDWFPNVCDVSQRPGEEREMALLSEGSPSLSDRVDLLLTDSDPLHSVSVITTVRSAGKSLLSLLLSSHFQSYFSLVLFLGGLVFNWLIEFLGNLIFWIWHLKGLLVRQCIPLADLVLIGSCDLGIGNMVTTVWILKPTQRLNVVIRVVWCGSEAVNMVEYSRY